MYAFEPTDDSADRFLENVKKNSINNIKISKVGLGKEREKQKPMFGDNDWGINDAGVRSLYGGGPVVCYVDVIPFDIWEEENNIFRMDIVKIDADGAEYDILLGMKNAIKKYTPRYIILELKESELALAEKNSEDIISLLESLGYKIHEQLIEYNQIFKYEDYENE